MSLKELLINEYRMAEGLKALCQRSLKNYAATADKEYIEHEKSELKNFKENMKFIENAFIANNLDIKKELAIFNASVSEDLEEIEIIDTNSPSVADTIKLVSYDGAYPNLCSGILTVEINGEIERFDYCLESRVGHNGCRCEKYLHQGNWVFDPKFNNSGGHSPEPDFYYFKRQAKKPMTESTRREIERVINNTLPHGCCGGCD